MAASFVQPAGVTARVERDAARTHERALKAVLEHE
jgi:hypothetical protein